MSEQVDVAERDDVEVGLDHPHLDREIEAGSRVVVDARGVGRTFGTQVVLEGLDITIHRGEFVALLGRSGSGKSTFLRILAQLDSEFQGAVDIPDSTAVVFQDARLLPWQRVLANVILGLKDRDASGRGRQALAEVGLESKAKAWPGVLSGGEAQRVALARALVREPELMLLDEPFGALDALTRIKMHALLQQLCAKHRPGVLLVTHDVDEAIVLADRILVLTDGKISLDENVDIPSPRLRRDTRFSELRSRLLAELGVDEVAEGAHADDAVSPDAFPDNRSAA